MTHKIDKHAILEAFKQDLRASEELKSRNDAKVAQRRAVYRGDLYNNEEEGKSQIVPKVAKRQSEWAHASLKDPFVNTADIIKCNPVTFEDVASARQSELLLNTQFCRQFDRYNFITKCIKVLDVDATLIVQCGWETEDKEIEVEREVVKIDEDGFEYIALDIVTETVVTKNRPTAKVCRSEDIFIDPTCQDDFNKAQFIVYRHETDISSLKKDGRYSNLDKIEEDSNPNDSEYISPNITSFKFQDKPRKKIIVYEYWGNYDIDRDGVAEPIVCSWVGDVIIRLQANPLPDGKPPFLVIPFSSVPFQMYGENNLDLIADQQKVITALTRGFINNMASSTNGQVGVRKGALDPVQKKRFYATKNFEFNTSPTDIWQGHYNQLPSSAFNMLALQNNEVESLTGTKGFSGGLSGGSLGSTATGVRGVLDATSTRRLDLVRNLAENLIKPLMRKWMSYNAEFLSDEEVVRITNSEFIPIKRDDLRGEVDIDIVISTAEDNANKSQELSFLLQTLGNTVPFELTQKLLAKIAGLSKLPDLEKELAEYKPEPDPVEEKLKQLEVLRLELEAQKLEAEIAALRSETKENEGDQAEKFAAARVKNAQAEKLIAETTRTHSQTHKLDLDYIKADEQVDVANKRAEEAMAHQKGLEKAEQDRLINLEAMEFQARNNDNNIGVLHG